MSEITNEPTATSPAPSSGSVMPGTGDNMSPSAESPRPVEYHEIPAQKNADPDEILPSKEDEVNEKQEGEWRQPGQDEFPGVENAPRNGSPGGTENPSRRYF